MRMKMRPWLWSSISRLFAVVALLSACSFAQEIQLNYLGLGFGGSDYHLKDGHASPLIFGDIGIAPTIQFLYRGDEIRQYVEGSYYDTYLSTTSDNFHTSSRGGRIRYGYLRLISNIRILNQHLELYLGGSANSFLSRSDYYYLDKPPDTRATTIASWYWSHSVDIAAQLEYNPGGREFLTIQCWIPVVSNVSRPGYSSSADYNYDENTWKMKAFGKTEFFTQNFSVDASVMYQRSIFGRFNIQLSYEFYYSWYGKPSEIGMYMNNLRAGLFFCF